MTGDLVTPGPGFRNTSTVEIGAVAVNAGIFNFHLRDVWVRGWLTDKDEAKGVRVEVDGWPFVWTTLRAVRRVA